MGLLDFGAVADSGVKGPYTDYDAAITALRSDVTASDGDLYQLDNDMTFNAFVSEGPGILIPSDLYDRVSAYVDNASGDAYFISADTEAEIVARGWAVAEANGGSVTGGNGSAFRCDSGAASGSAPYSNAQITFTPTTPVTRCLVILKLQAVSGGTRPDQTYAFAHYDNVSSFRVVSTSGANGVFQLYRSSNVILPEQIGKITDTSATWFAAYCDRSATTNVVYFRRLEDKPEEAIAAEVGDLAAVVFNSVPYLRVNGSSGGSQCVIDYYECHALETT